jgi:hypothetical protein
VTTKVAAADPVVQAFEQQYAPRFRQLYRSELHFMRIVCQPTRQQFEKIAADGERDLKAAIKQCALKRQEMQMGRFRAGDQQPDPRKLVTTGLVNAIKARLSSEQAARYRKELEQRDVARKRVALLVLVAGIDKKLVLSVEQRDKLSEILDNNWNDSWNQTQQIMMGGQYFPILPDAKILPILTETQKTVWRTVPKGNVYFGFSLDMFQGIEVEEEVWLGTEEKK